jgi:hypothetical protein
MALEDEARRRASPDAAASHETTTREDEVLACRACRHALAHASDRIEVLGKHYHVFVNPSAVEFRIGCYARADGCSSWGDAETFWSWFPGCAWRVALCARCTAHVGWSFERAEGAFWGLILDRVV